MLNTINDIIGINTYWIYGGGPDEYNIDSLKNFKFQRAFCDNFRFDVMGKLAVQRNNQSGDPQGGFSSKKTDDYLQLLDAEDVYTVWCTQGKFSDQDTIGKAGKVMPINEGDDPLDINSWARVANHCKQIALRYAWDTPNMSHATEYWQPGDYRDNEPITGLDLISAIEIQNEWNFKAAWSGATRTITPEEYAVCFKACYDAIRSVSNIDIYMGGGIGASIDDIYRFLAKLDELYNGEAPSDFYINFHWYMREGSTDQDGGFRGISPEKAGAYEFGLELDSICEERNLLGWLCTETGWSSDQSDEKQVVPQQDGYSLEASVGLLWIRLALIWGSCNYCRGIAFWHCRDEYDSHPYTYAGIHNSDWSDKLSKTIIEDFKSKYGHLNPVAYMTKDGKHYARCVDSEGTVTSFRWSDNSNLGNCTPLPTEFKKDVQAPELPDTLIINGHIFEKRQ
jgi:hypothetical protein